MKISPRFILGLTAALVFAALPVTANAQHGHSGAGSNMNGPHDNHSGASATGNNVSDKLSNNTQLAGKLQGLLPQGTNLQTAAEGFKNLGQFVAAVHVSHNLDIPFDQLKGQMIGPPKESLGKAIHALKPDAKSRHESKVAKKEAKQDIKDTKSS